MRLAGERRPIHWDEAEPARLALDHDDLAAIAPDLRWNPEKRCWTGRLPRWPFDRPEPAGLVQLLPQGMTVQVRPSPAHPLTEPAIFPIDVDIEVRHRLDHRWHLAGDGRLCLLRTPLDWRPEDRLSELILKAAAWRCKLTLLETEVVTAMTENGIVSDGSRDHLFGYAALSQAWDLP